MPKVIHLPSPRAGTRVHTHAQANPTRDPVARQAAIENALSMALYFVRQHDNVAANLWAATARANRALTLLKQASEGMAPTSPTSTLGRA